MMKESDLALLVDSLRGLAANESDSQLGELLETNEQLRAASRGFDLVRSALAEEAPPESYVAIARALGSQRRHVAAEERLQVQLLRPVLDGLSPVKPAGSRTGSDHLAQASSSEILLEAVCEPHGPIIVELRVDRSADSSRAVVVGEILAGSEDDASPLAGVEVWATVDDVETDHGTSGEFGELYLPVPAGEVTIVWLKLDDGGLLCHRLD